MTMTRAHRRWSSSAMPLNVWPPSADARSAGLGSHSNLRSAGRLPA
jgi:hypothetical protein